MNVWRVASFLMTQVPNWLVESTNQALLSETQSELPGKVLAVRRFAGGPESSPCIYRADQSILHACSGCCLDCGRLPSLYTMWVVSPDWPEDSDWSVESEGYQWPAFAGYCANAECYVAAWCRW